MRFKSLLVLVLFVQCSFAQKTYKIAFYNTENLFDTIDGPNDDAEFLPQSKSQWNGTRYNEKLTHIRQVMNDLNRPMIVGFSEIENKSVLTDLTGGQDTVAIRAPAHPIAQELLRKFKSGVVAPSANRFGKVSPTSASDVRHEFEGMLDLMILDGGDCEVGIESTIIDLSSGDKAILLRPGAITPSEIFAKTGVKVYLPGDVIANELAEDLPKVSGSLKAHYAPTTPLRLYAPGRVLDALSEFPDIKSRVAVAVWDSDSSLGDDGHPSAHFEEVQVPSDSAAFASRLYRSLRDLDQQGWDLILFPEPPAGEEWDGVRDRLQRARFGSGPSSSSHVSS